MEQQDITAVNQQQWWAYTPVDCPWPWYTLLVVVLNFAENAI
jgi:hypothetical protein